MYHTNLYIDIIGFIMYHNNKGNLLNMNKLFIYIDNDNDKFIFNNGRYTTNIPTDPHTFTTIDIKQTCAIYIHLLSLCI